MWGGTDPGLGIATIQAAIDQGVTLIDTAPVYGFGVAETLVGAATRGSRRNRVNIATKCGLVWADGTIWRDASPMRLLDEVDASLRRLQTDYIDIYQIHWPDSTVAEHALADVLHSIKASGKVRAIGVCNFPAERAAQLHAICPLAFVQSAYNIYERDIDKSLIPFARANNIATIAHSALCRGLLTGSVASNTAYASDDVRSFDPKFKPDRRTQYILASENLAVMAKMRFDKPLVSLALRWILDRGVDVALFGARHPKQLAHLTDDFGWQIDARTMQEIDRIVDQAIAAPIGPEFMRPRQDREGKLPR